QSRPLVELEDLMRTVRNPDELLEIWSSWRDVAPPMADEYERMVEIANEGASELGFEDVGHMWRSKYDMDPDAFAALADTLWLQVKPLYDALHCYVRGKLSRRYGSNLVDPNGPIPAHLLGNMWAQQWANVFPLVAPAGADPGYDVTDLLVGNGYDALRMFQTADDFFVSLGFEPMPQTFWDRSLLTKPADREVVCHASAWSLDGEDDIRVKMCTKVNGDDFRTVHHEIGHNIYQRAYKQQSAVYREGANDGFHEAVGDMIALSITPEYLRQIGLLNRVPDASKDIGLLMQSALDKIAFLPFGLLVDKWRWQVFSGELTPDTYNDGWWRLREEYQGIRAPVERTADHFDPGAKYHVPNNTPYMRYFLAHILQFQFHRTACEIAGWDGLLHRCSIYGNKEVGERFDAMLQMGSSRPWQEALEAFTGSPEIDATAIIDYYAPLKEWLDDQNAGQQCGW
ncbi:MAG: M2 family metallopeptidase, partial [Rhodothermales bacterium]|nr:M2 family metallopeptidase [Rhodothermales bacterium]